MGVTLQELYDWILANWPGKLNGRKVDELPEQGLSNTVYLTPDGIFYSDESGLFRPLSGIGEWKAQSYGPGLHIVLHDNKLYRLSEEAARPFVSADFAIELEAGHWQALTAEAELATFTTQEEDRQQDAFWGAVSMTIQQALLLLASKLSNLVSNFADHIRTAFSGEGLQTEVFLVTADAFAVIRAGDALFAIAQEGPGQSEMVLGLKKPGTEEVSMDLVGFQFFSGTVRFFDGRPTAQQVGLQYSGFANYNNLTDESLIPKKVLKDAVTALSTVEWPFNFFNDLDTVSAHRIIRGRRYFNNLYYDTKLTSVKLRVWIGSQEPVLLDTLQALDTWQIDRSIGTSTLWNLALVADFGINKGAAAAVLVEQKVFTY